MKSKEYEKINEYLDWYESLLTAKQRDVMNLYYREDYSLAEIAENQDISRSAVSDLIRRVETILDNYEKKLHLTDKFHKRNKCYDELLKLDNGKVREIVKKLIEIE